MALSLRLYFALQCINLFRLATLSRLAYYVRTELDRLAEIGLTEARYPRLLALFRQATRLEADFWQMGLDQTL